MFKKTYCINPVNKALKLLTLCEFLKIELLPGSILLMNAGLSQSQKHQFIKFIDRLRMSTY